ncbi:TPA: phage tail tape measure protein [Streptococcus agalactiae]|nr:phage tail tape measure protein [Streptococcus agalactiae]HEM9614383.1 phage tail tape measure protein [Streptococcus agalactiae]HEO5887002.1 phage tail tape measure protein [Streptococcus agalactiae]
MSNRSYTVQAILKATDTNFTSTMNKVQSAAQATIDKIKSIKDSNISTLGKIGEYTTMVGQGMQSVGRSLSKYVTLPIVGLGVAAAKTFGDFESQMNRVKAISGATGADFEKLRKQAIDLGASSVFSAKEVAQGQEMMASAGFNANQILAASPGVMSLAAASGGDLALASEAAATAVNMFSLNASEATHVADVFAKAAADTNSEVADMAEALKYAGPVAGAMKISMEETAAAIGIMSNAGIKGSQAGTTLRTAITRLAKPTDQMQAVIDGLGLSFFDANGKMRSLTEITGQLRDKMSGLTDQQKSAALSILFGKESLSGMLALVNSAPGQLAKLTEGLKNSKGAADKMANTMNSGLKGAIEQLKGSLETAGITIGGILNPMLQGIIGKIQAVIDWFNKLSPAGQKTAVIIGGIVAAIGPLLVIFGTIIIFIGQITASLGGVATAFTAIAGVFSIITGPVILIIAAIGAFIAILVVAWNTSETFRNTVISGWKAMVEAITPLIETLKQIILSIFTFIQANSAAFIGGLKLAWNALVEAISGLFLVITGIVQVGMTIINTYIKVILAIINGDWNAAWSAIKSGAGVVWEGIKNIIIGALTFLASLFVSMIGVFVSTFSVGWTAIKGVFSVALKFLVNVVTAGMKAIGDKISSEINLAKTSALIAFNVMKTGVATAMNAIKETVFGIVNKVKNILNSLASIDLGAAGRAIMDGFLNGLASSFERVKNFVGGIAGWIRDHKGPISYDRTLLIPAGFAIMGGLNKSLTEGFSNVKENVSKMAEQISDEFQNGLNKINNVDVFSTSNSLQNQIDVTHRTSFSGFSDSARKLEDDKFVVLKEAISSIRDLANRDVIVTVDGKELARTTADDITNYQKQKEILNNRMKGLI